MAKDFLMQERKQLIREADKAYREWTGDKALKKKRKQKLRRRKRYVYVLKLEQGKYYIGQTVDVDRRYAQHLGKIEGGATWTKTYRPLEIIEVIDVVSGVREVSRMENEITIKYAIKYGVDNVRGGKYCGNGTTALVRDMYL
jgi:predicted GIY-YIG superfamily endonuclease